MSIDHVDGESAVSGNQANIPARIRDELDIEDGDRLRWSLGDDGSVTVEVVQQREGTFADFDGYGDGPETDAAEAHDAWGLE